jgi:thymidine phosphorylase
MNRATQALKLRKVKIDTHRENVAYLLRACTVCRVEGFAALSRIAVRSNGKQILAVLNVVDDPAIVGADEIGLSEEAFDQFDMAEGGAAYVEHAERPGSIELVKRKINGDVLGVDEYRAIIRDVTEHRYSKPEIAAFLVACAQNELDHEEVLGLTRAMTESGERMDWREPLVADKHCIGGIPGNRTSMLVVPIVAAHGLLIPKTSSRAITSPAGTADTMEVLARVELPLPQLKEIVVRERGCIAWGGTAKLAPADDILIAVERPLGFDSQGQMVASILSKKYAAGSTHLLIDIPVGPSAKVRSMRDAQRLRKRFEYVGSRMGLHVEVVITDGRQPVGRGIGPVLEARDVMQVLQNDPGAPADLREKALRLAGRVLEFDADVRGGQGYAIARDILESGRALAKMAGLIDAQGRQPQPPKLAKPTHEIAAPRNGWVTAIDNYRLARMAHFAGAPMAAGAGIDLLKKLGSAVSAGEALYRIHADYPAELAYAREFAQQSSGYTVGDEPVSTQGFAVL